MENLLLYNSLVIKIRYHCPLCWACCYLHCLTDYQRPGALDEPGALGLPPIEPIGLPPIGATDDLGLPPIEPIAPIGATLRPIEPIGATIGSSSELSDH